MTINEIRSYINTFAPFSSAMSYDNVGVLIGSGEIEVTKAVVSLDATMETLEYAVAVGANLVITHHPVIFDPIKKISADSVVYQYIRHGVAVLSAHTNLDMAKGGLNDLLAKRLDLTSISGFDEAHRAPYQKITVKLQRGSVSIVMNAMKKAGAKDFFTTEGEYWYENKVGELVSRPAVKLETICPPEIAGAVIAAMLDECPEPHPSYDVAEDTSRSSVTYLARTGILSTPMMPDGLCSYVKERLGLESVGLVCREGMEGHYFNRIGICSGAGGSLLYECARKGIEVLITSEIKHNVALDALEMGIVMIDAGHYGTELIMVPAITRKLEKEFPQLEVLPFVQQQPIVTL